jgi:uncharacterized membrane protein
MPNLPPMSESAPAIPRRTWGAIAMAAFRILLAVLLVIAGANHLRVPDFYLTMMPPYLPVPGLLILISGLAEMAGGVLLLIPQTRRLAAYGLIALLVAVFPANLHLVFHHDQPPWNTVPVWVLWLRLPLQLPMIAWVYVVALRRRAAPVHDAGPAS